MSSFRFIVKDIQGCLAKVFHKDHIQIKPADGEKLKNC